MGRDREPARHLTDHGEARMEDRESLAVPPVVDAASGTRMIPSDRWRQVKALFAEALDRAPDARPAFLAAACPHDAAMRHEVEELLAADAEAASFIEEPAMLVPGASAPDVMAMPSLHVGDRLGPYEIVEFVGAGGMGEGYKARDPRLGRYVAVKVLVAAAQGDAALARLDREARSASALNHPNIVTIYDIGGASSGLESVAYIAMELVEGCTLRNLLSGGALPTDQLLDIAVQIADALAAAHSKGIVHRDLKPENIMIGGDGRVKILDFGLARVDVAHSRAAGSVMSGNADHVTQAGTLVGTAAYMSPQQASGVTVDFRSDQFSFGTILYEMATGRAPFQRQTAAETLTAIIGVDVEPVGDVACGLPAPFQWIVTRWLAKHPEDRYASTELLARELVIVRQHVERPPSGSAARVHNLPSPRTKLGGRDRERSSARARAEVRRPAGDARGIGRLRENTIGDSGRYRCGRSISGRGLFCRTGLCDRSQYGRVRHRAGLDLAPQERPIVHGGSDSACEARAATTDAAVPRQLRAGLECGAADGGAPRRLARAEDAGHEPSAVACAR